MYFINAIQNCLEVCSKSVIAVANLTVAAKLITRGRTAHSAVMIPVPLRCWGYMSRICRRQRCWKASRDVFSDMRRSSDMLPSPRRTVGPYFKRCYATYNFVWWKENVICWTLPASSYSGSVLLQSSDCYRMCDVIFSVPRLPNCSANRKH